MPGSFRCAAIRLRRAKASSGINCPVEHSRSAIASPFASPACRLIVFPSRHGLLAFPSLYWRRAEEEGRRPPSVHRVGARSPGRWGNAGRNPAPAPRSNQSPPPLASWRLAPSAAFWLGLRIPAAGPATYDTTPIAAFVGAHPKSIATCTTTRQLGDRVGAEATGPAAARLPAHS